MKYSLWDVTGYALPDDIKGCEEEGKRERSKIRMSMGITEKEFDLKNNK